MEIIWFPIFVFKLVDTFLEERIGVDFVVGYARAKHIDECEAFVSDTSSNQIRKQLRFAGETASYVSSARCDRKCKRIERSFGIADRRGLRNVTFGGCWRSLSCRQTIDLIVHNHVGYVQITAHGVQQVTDTNSVSVAITTGDDHF